MTGPAKPGMLPIAGANNSPLAVVAPPSAACKHCQAIQPGGFTRLTPLQPGDVRLMVTVWMQGGSGRRGLKGVWPSAGRCCVFRLPADGQPHARRPGTLQENSECAFFCHCLRRDASAQGLRIVCRVVSPGPSSWQPCNRAATLFQSPHCQAPAGTGRLPRPWYASAGPFFRPARHSLRRKPRPCRATG